MKLASYFDCLDLHRDDKFVSLRFARPFRVLSTGPAHGGLTDGLDMVWCSTTNAMNRPSIKWTR